MEEDVAVEACGLDINHAILKDSELVHGLKQVYKKMIKADKYAISEKISYNYGDSILEDNKQSKGDGVKIAIIDSGIDGCSDVEVEGRINLVPGQEEVTPFLEDETGHGTAIAGIIAGQGNDTDVVGINTDAKLYSAKVFDGTNSAPLSRVIEGIYWAIDNEVDIINLSFGIHSDLEALKNAVDKAIQKEILVIAAVGNNENEGVMYPAAYEGVLAVGSVDTNAEHSKFSARGEEVDVVAVGEQVVTTGVLDGVMVTEGTSMAVPQVAAVASVILEKHPDATNEVLAEVIKQSSSYLGDEISNGYGLVNLEKALEIYDDVVKDMESKEDFQGITSDIDKKGACDTLEEIVIDTYEIPDCVSGQWTGTGHKDIVSFGNYNNGSSVYSSSIINIIKSGAVFADKCESAITNSAGNHVCLQGFRKPRHNVKYKNGDWHGNYNYAAAFTYAYLTALYGVKNYDSVEYIFISNKQFSRIKRGISRVYEKTKKDGVVTIKKNCAIGKQLSNIGATISNTNANYFLFGMSLHILSDIFAHRAYEKKNNGYKHIVHTKDNKAIYFDDEDKKNKIMVPDSVKKISKRFTAAKKSVKMAMSLYKSKKVNVELVFKNNNTCYDSTLYKLGNLSEYVKEIDDTGVWSELKKYTISETDSGLKKTELQAGGGMIYGTSQQKAELKSLLLNPYYYYWLYSDIRVNLPYDETALKNHYINNGIYEGRTASPIFHPTFYMQEYDDVAEYCNGNYAKAYEHFINIGFWEGRQGSMFFDVNHYLDNYNDLWNAFGTDYLSAAKHFMSYGINEFRVGSSDFDLNVYVKYNQDLYNTYGRSIPMAYFVYHCWKGWMENRVCALFDDEVL